MGWSFAFRPDAGAFEKPHKAVFMDQSNAADLRRLQLAFTEQHGDIGSTDPGALGEASDRRGDNIVAHAVLVSGSLMMSA